LPVALSRFGFFSIVQNSNEEIIASVKALFLIDAPISFVRRDFVITQRSI
jgi:hypothetical protein